MTSPTDLQGLLEKARAEVAYTEWMAGNGAVSLQKEGDLIEGHLEFEAVEPAQTIIGLIEEIERLRGQISKSRPICPFEVVGDERSRDLAETDPCPVCGGLGTADAEVKCVVPPKIMRAKSALSGGSKDHG